MIEGHLKNLTGVIKALEAKENKAKYAHKIVPVLQNTNFFTNKVVLQKEELEIVCQNAKYKKVPAGYTVYNKGDVGDSAYFILRGSV